MATPNWDTTFTRTFLFSILLTLLIASVAWVLFRYIAAQPTAIGQAQSIAAKYQLVEHNAKDSVNKLPFHYLVAASQPEPSEPLQFYWQKVKREMPRSLPQDIEITHNEHNGEIYLWIASKQSPGQWIGLQLSHNRLLFPFNGGAYILTILMLSIVPSYIYAQALSKPFAKLSDAVEVIAAGGIPNIEPRYWPLEAKRMANTLKLSALKLKQETACKEEMLLGISHDLRTPLTRSRLAVDFLHQYEPPLVEGVFADIDEMNVIIDQFISFVREGKKEKSEKVNINKIVQAESNKFGDIGLQLASPFDAWISPISLRRMLSNLISNAIKHGLPPIEVRTANDAANWSVTVIDRGKGIPEDMMAEMIKPFKSADVSGTNGVGGLGLSIVDRIVGAQGGQLKFDNLGSGGFSVKVIFSKKTKSAVIL